ncbi:MAG: nucleoside deaminase [Clostridia bacterium]|nr:nucleoside deaminase [Clostridia bacterium]
MMDEAFMREALAEAQIAFEMGEVPIGAVLVWDGRIVARAHNTRELEKNALGHAECSAIAQACGVLGGWRLHRAVLYVTLEPCPMCAGAIVNARIPRVVWGADDARAGAFGSVMQMNDYPLNHKPELVRGVLAEECGALMTSFFERLREKRSSGIRRLKKSDFMK